MEEEELIQLAMLLSLEEQNNSRIEKSLLNASVEDPSDEREISGEKEKSTNENNNNNNNNNNLIYNELQYYNDEEEEKEKLYDELHLSTLSSSVANILLGIENALNNSENANNEANNNNTFNNLYQLEDVLAELYSPYQSEEEPEDEFSKIINMQNREITENDYATLLTLNEIAPPVKRKRRKRTKDLVVEDVFNKQFTHNECGVCLEDFEENEKLYLISECLHPFHPNCLRKWFREKLECPICRIKING